MKIVIEPPDFLFRLAKAYVAVRGVALKKRLVRDANVDASETAEPPWMAGFGGLSDLGEDHRRVREAIEDEFGGILPKGACVIRDARASTALSERMTNLGGRSPGTMELEG